MMVKHDIVRNPIVFFKNYITAKAVQTLDSFEIVPAAPLQVLMTLLF